MRGPLRRAITVADMLREVNRFLVGKRGWAVIAESGDMLFAGLDVKIGRGGAYLAQGYYASMGFGVPGALGLEIGTRKRPIVLCGDGAFQMTGVELAQAPRHGLRPAAPRQAPRPSTLRPALPSCSRDLPHLAFRASNRVLARARRRRAPPRTSPASCCSHATK